MSDERIAQKGEEKGTRLGRRLRREIARRAAFTYLDWLASFAWFLLVPLILLLGYTGLTLIQLALTGLPTDPESLRWHALAFAGLVAILGGLVGAPLALIRVYVAERTAKTAEQGHITDRITKAVEQLGAEKTVKVLEDGKTVERTEPNLEVRLGAIYALERIAQDSERDHIPIMETLCAYVRENSNARTPRNLNLAEWEPLPDDADEEAKARHGADRDVRFSGEGNARAWAQSLPAQLADMQAALTVIGRRSKLRRAHEASRFYQLDLRKANLQGANLSRLAFERAQLKDARMEGADLGGALMEGADLRGARMEGADLGRAQMEGAVLSLARMKGANLWGARMEGANLRRAWIEGAILRVPKIEAEVVTETWMEGVGLGRVETDGAVHRGARMEGAILIEAWMEGADLSKARLEGAILSRARLKGAKLSGAWLERAVLIGARMTEADLSEARLEGAILSGAQLDGANLSGAWMEGATLREARMKEADLNGARMLLANLSGAQLNGADLGNSRMQEAKLIGTSFRSSDLEYARFVRANSRAADFSGAGEMTQDQVNSMFGDRSTILPEGLRRTDLMDREPLENPFGPDPDYEAWLAAGAPPGKPLP